MNVSNYTSTRIERGKQLRQNLENSAAQDLSPLDHKKLREEDLKIQQKNIEKNSVISSYSREMKNLTAIERLKKEYGIEKNIVLTKENVEVNRELIEKYVEFFSAYPDIFLDLILPAESKFHLYFYQRIFLRACMRFKYHYCIASRGYSKSFLAILAGILRCIFLPGTTMFLVAPGASQGVEIAQEKINIILNTWPLLASEVAKKNESQKEINLFFKNGSNFDVLTVTSKSRGLRRNAGIIDETRDHQVEKLNQIVIPVMNISRRTASGAYNQYEKHQPQTWISSASQKSDYNYQKLIDFLERSILDPDNIYVEGCDYHVPVACGLMPQDFINDVKNDATFNEIAFAQEYLSIFTGGAANSWLPTSKLTRLRKIVNPHYKSRIKNNSKDFYVISVDVARSGEARSIACVWQVLPQPHPKKWIKKLVNMYNFKGDERHFQDQANALKKLISLFDPKEVIIDGTGLGRGLLDFMVIETFDEKTGQTLPAYGSFNDEELKKVQPTEAPKIINVLIANASLNSEIFSITYSEIVSGHVRLLIEENEAKSRLMATKIGQKMTLDKRVAKLMPYEMTSRLIDEIGNLRLKTSVSSKNIAVERINKDIQKDRFSALSYGLYTIHLMEEQEMKKNRRGKRNLAKFIMKN